jgi:RNA polymerase sigma-70 factor (ECF subfamily)
MPEASDPRPERVDPSSDDASIVESSLDDPEAFGVIFDRHSDAIHRYLARRVGRDDADDLLGDVFIAAFQARHRYDPSRSHALPWLYGIAANLSARTFRSRTRAAAAAGRLAGREPPSIDPHDQQTDRLDAEAAWPDLAIALDSLADGHRDALLLYVWEDLSYDEISIATDVPIGTVRSRISRARATLRELLEAERETKHEQRDESGMDER